VAFGLRHSLAIAAAATAIIMCVAIVAGLLAGFFAQRLVDTVLMRIVDGMLSIPLLVTALVVVGSIGPSSRTVVLAIVIGLCPSQIRVVRAAVLSEASLGYVESARAVGAGALRIMFRHILPNIVSVLLILASASLGFAILVESGLSFLGLGPPPQEATLGRILAVGGQRYWDTAPWLAIFPGLALVLTILSVNLLGDALRDILDPRTRA
jgi:peptide/nickel transport system permease protein